MFTVYTYKYMVLAHPEQFAIGQPLAPLCPPWQTHIHTYKHKHKHTYAHQSTDILIHTCPRKCTQESERLRKECDLMRGRALEECDRLQVWGLHE
jgi:hypothetical protein